MRKNDATTPLWYAASLANLADELGDDDEGEEGEGEGEEWDDDEDWGDADEEAGDMDA